MRTVLDIGAGEGRWYPTLRRLRAGVAYTGVDSSRWAVRHWASRRHLRLGSIDMLDQLDLVGPFDLIVVADVLHYLPDEVLHLGMRQVRERLGGVAYLPTFTANDEIEGDKAGFQRRDTAAYRRVFRNAGLVELGMFAWTTAERAGELSGLQVPGGGRPRY
ncbi:MAG: methyltransferase domain-containing protein [Gemmatimonadales bacterium]